MLNLMPGRLPILTTRSPARAGGMAGAVVAALAAALVGCDDRPEGAAPLPVLRVIGELGQSPGQFIYPRALDNDGTGLWVIDKAARVQRLDPTTGDPLCGWSMPDSALGKPVGVTIAPGEDGKPAVYIPDTHYNRILVYRAPDSMGAQPELLRKIGEIGDGPGQFTYPTDVAVLPGSDGRPERIFVSEYGGHDRISIFDGRFNFLASFGTMGDSADPANIQFDRPQSIAIEPTLHELIVTDSSNHRLGRFTLDGALVAWIGSPETAGAEPGQFRYPYGLHLPGDGTALVSEFGNNRVQQIDLQTGASLGVWGRGGRGDGEVVTPWGITVMGKTAFVLDAGNNRVLAFPAPRAGGRHG
jgi:DNA-binding beta-propeller fold protein YncE